VFFWRIVRLSLSLEVVALLALVVAVGCGGDDDGGDSGKVQVVTTLPLFADFVREVGGDRVEVTSLVPNGADPHTWEPSPSDVKKVTQADIAFANGLDLEPSAERLIEANLKDGAPFVKLGDEYRNATPQPGTRGGDRPIISKNPHLWLDAGRAGGYAFMIQQHLVELDNSGRDIYPDNFGRYLEQLTGLDEYVQHAVDTVPVDNRKIVATHNAFEYFGYAYSLETIAVVAVSPGQEPSPEDVADIVRVIEDEDVPAVFREPQVDAEGRILEQAAKDASVQVCTLYSDSLDDEVNSYIEMMRFNADEIARCLGGDSDG